MKSHYLRIIKFSISFSLLAYIFWKIDIRFLLTNISQVNFGYYLITLLNSIFFVFLIAYRWKIVMYWQNHNLIKLIKLVFVGFLFNNFLPSTVGGDIYRIYGISDQKNKAYMVTASIVFTRYLNIYFMMAALFVDCLLPIPESVIGTETYSYLLYLCGFFLIAGILIFYIPVQKVFEKINIKVALVAWIKDMILCVLQYKNHPKVVLRAAFWSILFQMVLLVNMVLLSMAANLHVNPLLIIIFVSIIYVATMLPVSINGLGIREGGLIFLLGSVGITNEKALLFSLLLFSTVVFPSIIGGIIYGFDFKRKKT